LLDQVRSCGDGDDAVGKFVIEEMRYITSFRPGEGRQTNMKTLLEKMKENHQDQAIW
jgi:hypothetical protein